MSDQLNVPILSPHTCSTCAFKVRVPEDPKQIMCKRFPPTATPVLAMTATGADIKGFVNAFPTVQGHDWCWEHPDLIKPGAKRLLQS